MYNLAVHRTDRHVPLHATCWNGRCQMMCFLSGHNLALDFSASPVSNHPLPGHVRVRLKDLLELDSRFTRTRCNQASPRGLGRTAGVRPFASWQGLLKTKAVLFFFFFKMSIEKQKAIQRNIKGIFIGGTFKAKDCNSSASLPHSHFKLFVNMRQKLLGLTVDFPPWPIPEWSWIIPTQSSEGLFCSPGPTLCWCNAPRLCFSDECASQGPRQEEGKLLPSTPGMAGRQEA